MYVHKICVLNMFNNSVPVRKKYVFYVLWFDSCIIFNDAPGLNDVNYTREHNVNCTRTHIYNIPTVGARYPKRLGQFNRKMENKTQIYVTCDQGHNMCLRV